MILIYMLCKLGYKLGYNIGKFGHNLVKSVDFKRYIYVTYAMYELLICYLTFWLFGLRLKLDGT